MNGWINVKGRFPGFGEVCKIKGKHKGLYAEGVAIAYICPEYENLMWHNENEEPVPWEVTHWKPHTKQDNLTEDK